MQLLRDVAGKLREMELLIKAQQQAVDERDAKRAEELHPQIQRAVKAKERAIEAWTKHHREHVC